MLHPSQGGGKRNTFFVLFLNNHPPCFWCRCIDDYLGIMNAIYYSLKCGGGWTGGLYDDDDATFTPTIPPQHCGYRRSRLHRDYYCLLRPRIPPLPAFKSYCVVTVVCDREVVTEWDTNFFMIIALHHRRRAPMINKLPNEWEATYLV